MDIAKRVAKNAMYRTAALIIGNVSGLFLTVYLARLLKPEQFGIYSLALSIAMLAIAFANLGIDGAVVRYIAYYAGRQDLKKVRGHFKYFLRIKLFLITIVSALIVISSGSVATFFRNYELAAPLLFSGLLVFFASFTNFFNSFFVGLQEFKFVFLRQVIYEISRWVFVIPLATLFLAAGAVGGVALAYLATMLLLAFMVLRKYGEYVFGEADARDDKVRVFMGFMTIASISGIIYVYVDSLMLGYFIGAIDVGYYRAAFTIVFAIVGILGMADVLFPVFTQLGGNDLSNAVNRLAKYTSAIAFPAAVGLAFLSENIVKAIYGIDYLLAATPLTILSFVLIPASFNYFLTIFNAREIPQYSAYITTASMLLNVLLNFILINLFGINGAAMATLISRIFAISAAMYLLYRILRVRMPVKTPLKPAFCSFIMLLELLMLPSPTTLFMGIVEVVLAAILYFLLLFAVKGLTKEDINYILISFSLKR